MDQRPAVAIISNSLTPSRQHFHRRVVREVPEIELWSLFTHEHSSAPWSCAAAVEIQPVQFGPGDSIARQSSATRALHEWRKGGRVIGWLRQHAIRMVVLMGYNDFGRLRILRWCRTQGVPCFLFGDSSIRGDRWTGWRRHAKRRLVTGILRRTSGVLACGSLGRAYFRRYGVPDESIGLMPYEPDYERIERVSGQDVRAAFQHVRVPLERRRIVFSGRLISVKRVDLVIDAFLAIADERPDWDLLLVGDGPLRAQLARRVPRHFVSRVHWVGFIDDEDLLDRLYRGSHVLVLPSDVEPWGVVVNEAVAAGMAVVASDIVGAAAELVRDQINGRVFPAGDLARLTECLHDVTTVARLERYRAASAEALHDWRRRADPVAGLRWALERARVLAA